MRQTTLLLSGIFLSILLLPAVSKGQNGFISVGSTTIQGKALVSYSLGQLYVGSQDYATGKVAEGVQRAIAKVSVDIDSTACSSDSLPLFVNAATGGELLIQSKIGTTVDTMGNLLVGTNLGNSPVTDTISFTFNGYTNVITLGVKKGISLKCQDASLYVDDLGQVYLDSQQVSTLTNGMLTGEMPYTITDTILTCMDGLNQSVLLTSQFPTICDNPCEVEVSLIDTVQPMTGCLATKELVLLWSGATLTPASLQGNTTDNCSNANLDFSFSSDFSKPSLELTCRDKIEGMDSVTVYVRDESNNITSCVISLDYNEAKGVDCNCDFLSFNLKGLIVPNDYKAKETLTAEGSIKLKDTVFMTAGEKISFLPGFSVSKGSTLLAKIDVCGYGLPQTLNSDLIEGNEMYNKVNTLRVAEDKGELELGVEQFRAYPNPFQAWFRVSFAIEQAGAVSLKLYNMQGGQIYSLLSDAIFASGKHELRIDGSRINPGMYALRLEIDGKIYSLPLIKMN